LIKHPAEKNLINSDINDHRWAILGDKAYIGPDSDTPDLRRIKLIKAPTFQSEIARNVELSKIRVPIECWFGRFKMLWKIMRQVYKLDHRLFDAHFEILGHLTNEHIRANSLTDQDQRFYHGHLQELKERNAKRKEKRAAGAQLYKQRKFRRLQRFA